MDQDSAHMVAASKVLMLKPDAKKLLEVVEKRFGGNAATRKTQRNLLKQEYENFTTPISEMLDQNFDRLQNLVSQLELLDEKLSQEDVNQKLLRSLSPEWNTHAVVWRNADLDTMSMDDLYNNLKDCPQIHPRMTWKRNRFEMAMALTMMARSTTTAQEGQFARRAKLQEIKTTKRGKHKKECACEKHLLPSFVPPPYTRNFMPPTPDLSFTGLDEFVNEPVVENCKAMSSEEEPKGNPQMDLHDQAVIDSGCSRHMTGNMSYLTNYEEIDRGYVAFGGNPKGGKITGKGTIKTGNLDFENVYFVRELKFNLFSVSQMCDKKNSVLFNDTECIVLSPNFKLIDESQVLLRVPRKNNMYSVDLKNIVPKGGLTCLFAKATSDESKLWHRRLGHLNFKTMNKLVKGNLVRGLPSKLFENDQTCVACQKGKQHRASYPKSSHDDGSKPSSDDGKKVDEDPRKESECKDQEKEDNVNSTNNVNTVSSTVNAASTNEVNGSCVFSMGILKKGDVSVNQLGLEDSDFLIEFQSGEIDKTLFIKRNKVHDNFQMSSMGELTFFLGLQVQQKKDGIFISQDKYVAKILKKFGFTEVKTASTPMETQKPLLKDEDGEEVDVHMYRLMIGSLMYLTSLRPDIMFAVCACTRYQVNPKVSHLYVVKRIFKYLKGQPKLGLWYPKDSPFDLVAYTDSDYTRASLDRKSTTGGKAKKSVKLMMEKLFRMELELMLAKNINGEEQLHALVDGKKIIITESSVRRDLQLADEEGKGFSGRVTPLFPTIMVQNQSQIGEGSANPTDPHHTPTFIQPSPQPQKIQKTRKLKRKGTRVPQPSDPTRSVVDEVVHKELGDSLVRVATTASSLEAEQDSGNITKTRSKATPNESSSLGTTSGGSPKCQETMGDTIAQTRIDAIDVDKEITLVSVHDLNVSAGEEVAEEVVEVINIAKLIIDAAQVSVAGDKVSTASAATTISKGILIEPMKKKDQILLDEETALNLQAEFDDEERLAREKAEKMQAQEHEELSVEEKATLFQQLLKKRRRHFAAKRAEEKRNKPLTKVQQRKKIYTYLKNMEGYKLNDLKLKEFDSIQEMFNRAFKRQKVEDDKETARIKKLMEIIPDEEEVAIDAIPLAVKSPSIVDWKIHKEGRKSYTFLEDATYADLYVGREEVSSYTIYTYIDVGKEAYD
ncbi:uncharacterized mitochondrial protein-like protein [Tanacetum coccineum]